MLKEIRRGISLPIGSMYDIFTYIWLICMVNVSKYTIHGWYGLGCFDLLEGWDVYGDRIHGVKISPTLSIRKPPQSHWLF